jgi:hypothetical protein
MSGDAFTLVAPDEEKKLAAIERFIAQKIERLTLEGFQVPPNGNNVAPKSPKSEVRMDGRKFFRRGRAPRR